MIDNETIKATAGAVQATAEAVKSGFDLADKIGRFFAPMVRGPADQFFGYLEDRIRFARADLVNGFAERLRGQLVSIKEFRELPWQYLADAIEQGVYSEEEVLQDMWSRLIAGAADAESGSVIRRAHISVLKDFSSLDAAVFERVYSVQGEKLHAVVTRDLPRSTRVAVKGDGENRIEPPEEIILSLSNLARLGCLAYGSTYGGGEVFDIVNQNRAGQDLYRALARSGR